MNRKQRRAFERLNQPAPTQIAPSPAAAVLSSRAGIGGPRTAEGKAASSGNALTHGLTAAQVVLPNESESEFRQLVDGLFAEHQPATITEQIHTREMAENYWRLIRARNHEHALLSQMCELDPERDLERMLLLDKNVKLTDRYITRYERGFHKCLANLRKLQSERRAREADERKAAAQEESADVKALSTPAPACATKQEFVLQKPATVMPETTEFVSQNAPQPLELAS